MDIDANAVIEALKAQRNEALDELALTRAALSQVQAELNERNGTPNDAESN